MTVVHRLAPPARRGRTPSRPGVETAQVQSLTRGLSILECLAQARRRTYADRYRRARPAAAVDDASAARDAREDGLRVPGGDLGRLVRRPAGVHRRLELSRESRLRDAKPRVHAPADGAVRVRRRISRSSTAPRPCSSIRCSVARRCARSSSSAAACRCMHPASARRSSPSLPDDQIDAMLKVKGLPRITENTITSPETMWASIRVIRQRGWSFDDEEHLPGTRCVAAPIYDEHEEPLGAISLAGPSHALDRRAHQAARSCRFAYRRGDHPPARRPLAASPLDAARNLFKITANGPSASVAK